MFLGDLSKNIVPIYLGACRAIGRTSDDKYVPLFLRLFPPSLLPSKLNGSQEYKEKSNPSSPTSSSLIKKQTLPDLGKPLARTLTLHSSATWAGSLSVREIAPDLISLISAHSNDRTFNQNSATLPVDTQREIQTLFYKYGSCFSQLSQSNQIDFISKRPSKPYKFSLSQLQSVLSIAKSLLNKDLLETLDQSVKELYKVSSFVFTVKRE